MLKSKDALCLSANVIDQGLMHYCGADTILNSYYSIDLYQMKFQSAILFIGWLASISHWKLFKTTQILPFIKQKHTVTFKKYFYVPALWGASSKHQDSVYLANKKIFAN